MIWLEQIYWREPAWLMAIFIPVLILAILYIMRQRHIVYAEPRFFPWVAHSSASTPQARTTFYIKLLAWLCLCVAMAGPRVIQNTHYEDDNLPEVIFLLDVSRSMSVSDLTPSRLVVAKYHMSNFITKYRYRYGIILFAGNPHVLIPPSSDQQAVLSALASVDTNLLPTEGSRNTLALESALNLAKTSAETHIILVSDGGNPSDSTLQRELIKTINRRGIAVHSWGIGTSEGGLIPDKTSGWITKNGEAVISRLKDKPMRTLSTLTGGIYAGASNNLSSMDAFQLNTSSITNTASQTTNIIEWREYYLVFLLSGALLLMLPTIRIGRLSGTMQSAFYSTGTLFVFIAVLVDAQAQINNASDAWQALQNKDYSAASRYYQSDTSHNGKMGLGSAYYRLNQYRQAIIAYNQAILSAATDDERADAIFNLANSYYQLADYQQAVALYKDVLLYRHDDPAAQTNIQVAESLLEKQQKTRKRSRPTSSSGRNRIVDEVTINPDDARVSSGKSTQRQRHIYADEGLSNNNSISIEKSIQYSELASNEISSGSRDQWRYDTSDNLFLQQAIISQPDTDTLLWKRIFELEEGFPAPLDEPKRIRGVQPW